MLESTPRMREKNFTYSLLTYTTLATATYHSHITRSNLKGRVFFYIHQIGQLTHHTYSISIRAQKKKLHLKLIIVHHAHEIPPTSPV